MAGNRKPEMYTAERFYVGWSWALADNRKTGYLRGMCDTAVSPFSLKSTKSGVPYHINGSQKSGVPYQQVGVKKAVYPTSKWEPKKLRLRFKGF